MVGETNRLPFDLAEGEGELTGGFRTEYSSLGQTELTDQETTRG